MQATLSMPTSVPNVAHSGEDIVRLEIVSYHQRG